MCRSSAAAVPVATALLVGACSSGGEPGGAAAQSTPQSSAAQSSVAAPSTAAESSVAAPSTASASPSTPAPSGADLRALSPDQVVARARDAATRAGSVQVGGAFAQDGRSGSLDLRVQGEEGAGSLAFEKLKLDLVRKADELYLRGDSSFYKQFGGPEAAKLLREKWLRASPDEPQLREAADFLSLQDLMAGLLDPATRYEKGEETTVGGRRALLLRTSDGKGELAVALEGEPLPLRLTPAEDGAGSTGTLTFSRWGERFDIAAPDPADVVDPSTLPVPTRS